jgi:Domain of unknown function (DUF4190)/Septum formation
MTTPPAEDDDQQGTPRPQPQYPPPHGQAGQAGYPGAGPPGHRQAGSPGYSQPGYPPAGQPRHPQGQPGHPPPGNPQGQPGHPPAGQPGNPQGQPGYPPPGHPQGQPGYPPAGQPGHPQGQPGHPPASQPGHSQGLPGYPGAEGVAQGPPPYYPAAPASAGLAFPGSARPQSGSAVTSLVLGILGLLGSFFGALLAIVFGIVALVRIRRTGLRGRAMAMTGIVLGIMWTGLTVGFILLVLHSTSYGSVGGLQAGACFDNLQPGQASTQVHYLSSCAQPHNGQVVGTFVLSGSAWPGTPTVRREASAGCAALLGNVLRQQALSSGVSVQNYTPDQQAWSSGDRSASCVLLDPDTRHPGPMLAPGAP